MSFNCNVLVYILPTGTEASSRQLHCSVPHILPRGAHRQAPTTRAHSTLPSSLRRRTAPEQGISQHDGGLGGPGAAPGLSSSRVGAFGPQKGVQPHDHRHTSPYDRSNGSSLSHRARRQRHVRFVTPPVSAHRLSPDPPAVDNVAKPPFDFEPAHPKPSDPPCFKLKEHVQANGIDDCDDSSSEEEDAPDAPVAPPQTDFEDEGDEDDTRVQEDSPLRSATSGNALDRGDRPPNKSDELGWRISPPKPPKSLYCTNGRGMRFTPDARRWLKRFWIWILQKCRAEGRRLPTVNMLNMRSSQPHLQGSLWPTARLSKVIEAASCVIMSVLKPR